MSGREHRPTKSCSERVHSEAGFLGVKIIFGIKYRVAEEIENFSVIVLSARFEDKVDDATRSAAVARIGIGGLFAKLLNRVDRREDDDTETVMVFVVANPVQQEAIVCHALTVDRIGRRPALLCVGNATRDLRLS